MGVYTFLTRQMQEVASCCQDGMPSRTSLHETDNRSNTYRHMQEAASGGHGGFATG
jgi:hypothetical protein